MSALIEVLPALILVVGFLIVLTRIGNALNRIADALDYANDLTRNAWQDEYRMGRIQKPNPLRVLG